MGWMKESHLTEFMMPLQFELSRSLPQSERSKNIFLLLLKRKKNNLIVGLNHYTMWLVFIVSHVSIWPTKTNIPGHSEDVVFVTAICDLKQAEVIS